MNGNVAQNGISTAVQSVIIVLLGMAGGADYPGGMRGVAILVVASVLLGAVFGAFSNAVGMLVRERESIIGINTFLLLPLTFLSSAFMAPSQMPSWMGHIADFNPANWAMVAGRSAMAADPDWGDVLSRGERSPSSPWWRCGCRPAPSASTRSPSRAFRGAARWVVADSPDTPWTAVRLGARRRSPRLAPEGAERIGHRIGRDGEPWCDGNVSRAAEENNRRMLRARDAMDRAYAQPLDVPALARIAHVSQAHFTRTFRATFGETPHRYLQRRRVERAMFLLRETDRSVTDICFQVGFGSPGTFSRTFRDIVGRSPRTYRKEAAATDVPTCFTMAWTRPSA